MKAVRAVIGIVESGFVPVPVKGRDGWRATKDVALPADGPLTAEKPTRVIRSHVQPVFPSHYWFPCHDWEETNEWYPGFYSQGITTVMEISFKTRASCENFIETRILHAAPHVGSARLMSGIGSMIITSETEMDYWDSWIRLA